MLLDGVVYSRKRRDTFNEHALHQTVAPPPSRDPEELPLTPTTVGEIETSGSGQQSVPLHEESPGKVVHDPEHADPQSLVRGAMDRSIEAAEIAEDAPSEPPGSTATSRTIPLFVNVSSTATNYSHDRSTHITVAVDHLASSSSVSVGSDNSLASASVRQSPRNETSITTPRSPQGTSAKYTPKFPAADDVDVVAETRRREVHVVASKAPIAKLSRDDPADFDRDADNAGTSESSDIAESSGGTTTSASGAESAKLGADNSDYGQVVGGTAENGSNVFPVDYSDNIDGSTVEPTTITEIRLNNLTEDQQSNVSNSDSSEDPVEMNQEEVDASTLSPSMNVDETTLDTLLNKDENVEKPVGDIIEIAEVRDDVSEEKISSNENESAISGKSDGISKTINMIAKSIKSQTSGIVKETRELSREFSSSEAEVSSDLAKTSEQSEELQRDYPVPSYSYGQDEVEIVNLQHKKRPVETVEAEHPVRSAESTILNNDVKMNTAFRKERDKDDLRVVVRERSDEEFLRKFKEQFHEASADAESVENSPSIKTNYNSPPTDTLHETMHDSSGNASPRFSSRSDPPMTQRVQIVEVPVYRDGPSSSSSSFSSSPHRMLINVTIATEDSSAASSRPLYVLSVSVPTEGDAISRSSGINVDQVQVRTAKRLSEPSAASMKKIPANDESIDAADTRLPPPPQPPASPPAPIWAGGECECSCPCMGSSSDEWDNFSALDDDLEQEELESVNSTLAENFPEEPEKRLMDKKDGESAAKNSVRPNVTSTTEDYYTSSINDTVESGESTDETASTYEPEVSTDVWSCSGSTPLPPEPTILILEGEVPFSLFFCLIFSPLITYLLLFYTFTFYLSSSLMLMLTFACCFTRGLVKREFMLIACIVVVIVVYFVVVGSVICIDYNDDVILSHCYEFLNQFLHVMSGLISRW